MARLVWDKVGDRFYETGVKMGVLYPQSSTGTYPTGVAWNGLSSISESPSGADSNAIWADDIKYLNLVSREEYSGTIEAYTYPDEFAACDGSAELAGGVMVGQQKRTPFGLVYVTTMGNDTEGESYGYKIHIVYGCQASPSSKDYSSINDSPEAITFSWEFNTTPVSFGTDGKTTATITIDSTKADETKLKALEDVLFGKDGEPGSTARLPLPDEIKSLMTAA